MFVFLNPFTIGLYFSSYHVVFLKLFWLFDHRFHISHDIHVWLVTYSLAQLNGFYIVSLMKLERLLADIRIKLNRLQYSSWIKYNFIILLKLLENLTFLTLRNFNDRFDIVKAVFSFTANFFHFKLLTQTSTSPFESILTIWNKKN